MIIEIDVEPPEEYTKFGNINGMEMYSNDEKFALYIREEKILVKDIGPNELSKVVRYMKKIAKHCDKEDRLNELEEKVIQLEMEVAELRGRCWQIPYYEITWSGTSRSD